MTPKLHMQTEFKNERLGGKMNIPNNLKLVKRKRRLSLTTRPSYAAFLMSYLSILLVVLGNLYVIDLMGPLEIMPL